MSEELNNELSTSMVEPGNSVIQEDIAPVVEEPTEETTTVVEEPVKEEAPVVEEPAKPSENTITGPRYGNNSEEVQTLGSVANGAIGATTAARSERKTAPAKSKGKKETVALYSNKNVTWSGVGTVYRGYNIVGKEEADKWLTRDHVRIATPDEVAKAFGK